MARKDDFTGTQMHCIVCTNPIPPTRRKDAVTCSTECSKARKNFWRSQQDMVECRYCFRPSTPEERARYIKWRWAEKKAEKEATHATDTGSV